MIPDNTGKLTEFFLQAWKQDRRGKGRIDSVKRGFGSAAAMSRFDMMDKTTEEVINSIQITEGPVTTMSLGVQKSSRTPYSDATKVSCERDMNAVHGFRMDAGTGIGTNVKARLEVWFTHIDSIKVDDTPWC